MARASRRFVSAFAALALLAALATAAVSGALWFWQERLIFQPSVLPPDFRFAFEQDFEELRIPVPGATLNALHFRQPDSRGLVFFLHGNAGDLSTWTTGVDFYRRLGYDLFIFDYRGYGKSTGRIESEAQLRADVRAAWDAIAPRYAGRPIVIYGRSLGTGLAAYLARDVDPALVVLVTPFTSLAAAAKRIYPLVPEWLLRYPLRTEDVIGEVKSPIMLVHGTADEVIPLADARTLRGRARAPAELLVVQGAHHNDIHLFPAYLEGLAARLERAGAHREAGPGRS